MHYSFIIANKIDAFPDFLLNDVVILYVIFLLLSTFYRLIYLLRREGRCENENSPLSFLKQPSRVRLGCFFIFIRWLCEASVRLQPVAPPPCVGDEWDVQ